jgi:hypothetical protein
MDPFNINKGCNIRRSIPMDPLSINMTQQIRCAQIAFPIEITNIHKALVGSIILAEGYLILTDLVKDILFLWNSSPFY